MNQVDSHCRTSNGAVFPLAHFKAFTTFSLKTTKAKKSAVCAETLRRSQAKQEMFIQTSGEECYRLCWAPADSMLLGAAQGLVTSLGPIWAGLRGTKEWEHIQKTCCTVQKLELFYCALGVSWFYYSNMPRTAAKIEKNTLHDCIWQEVIHLTAVRRFQWETKNTCWWYRQWGGGIVLETRALFVTGSA